MDGGVHVGQAQVEEDLAHHLLEDPLLKNEVDDKERCEGHDGAISDGQVEDEQRGNGLLTSACQDAPDDKEVPWNTQEEDEAEDEGAYSGGDPVVHNGLICDVSRYRVVDGRI